MSPVWAVFGYELRRNLTPWRIGAWLALVGFPFVIVLLVRIQGDFVTNMSRSAIDTVWSVLFYMLIPCVGCALGVFLNAAPAVATELEQRSWAYVVSRPRGAVHLLLGKYLVAVFWAVTAAVLSVTLVTLLIGIDPVFTAAPGNTFGADSVIGQRIQWMVRIWFTMIRLCLLSSFAYAALYLLIGALFPRRAMVFCVAYTGVVEVILSLIPANINRLTVQYRLRSLMINWAEPDGQQEIRETAFFRHVFAEGGNSEQILWLLLLTVVFLVAALAVARASEFTGASESDV